MQRIYKFPINVNQYCSPPPPPPHHYSVLPIYQTIYFEIHTIYFEIPIMFSNCQENPDNRDNDQSNTRKDKFHSDEKVYWFIALYLCHIMLCMYENTAHLYFLLPRLRMMLLQEGLSLPKRKAELRWSSTCFPWFSL